MVSPPLAPIRKHSNFYHQHEFTDDFFWLRFVDDPKVLEYISQENEYADAVLAPVRSFQDILYNEMKSRTKEDDQTVPEQVDEYFYYSRTEHDREYEIYCRRKGSLTAPEEIYLNLNERTEGYIELGDSDISPDHTLLAYSLDFKGDEIYTIFIKNLITKKVKKFSYDLLGGSVCFTNDNKGLFFDVLNDVSIPSKVYFSPDIVHSNDSFLLFEELDNTKDVYFYRSKNKKYFVISSNDKDSSEVYFLDLTQTISPSSLKLFRKRQNNVIYQIYSHQDYFYILTNESHAINFKIMRVKEEFFDQLSAWEVFLPHNDQIQLSSLEVYDSFIVVHVRKLGIKNIMIYNTKTHEWHDIDFLSEIDHTINYHDVPANEEYFTSILRFNFSSLVTPTTTYDYNMENRTFIIRKIDEIKNYSSLNFASKRLLIKADDGTNIPLSLFFRKDLDLHADNPLLLYGYGAYGISSEPGFTPYALSLVERGFIYAIAHIRGGGEFGRTWYEEGKYEHKMNTFTDLIACMHFLIDNHFTAPDKLALRGASAGGLLLGAVINLAPNLIHTAVMDVPFLDVVNTMMDPSIPLTTLEFFEYGNPITSQEVFDRILSFSPYDNLTQLQSGKYPHMLILTSLYDSRVSYWEPLKYTAKLRSLKHDTSLLVLQTNLQAGHGGSSGRYQYLKELSLEYAFILYTINELHLKDTNKVE